VIGLLAAHDERDLANALAADLADRILPAGHRWRAI